MTRTLSPAPRGATIRTQTNHNVAVRQALEAAQAATVVANAAAAEANAILDAVNGLILGTLDVNGNPIGDGDTAGGTVGVVLRALAVANSGTSSVVGATSSVSVASVDATDLATVITLANEMKADLNTFIGNFNTEIVKLTTLKTNLNTAITQLNALLTSLRNSGALAT